MIFALFLFWLYPYCKLYFVPMFKLHAAFVAPGKKNNWMLKHTFLYSAWNILWVHISWHHSQVGSSCDCLRWQVWILAWPHNFLEIDHEIFSTAILPILQVQEEAVLKRTHNLHFWAKIRKIIYISVNSFSRCKVGFSTVFITWIC